MKRYCCLFFAFFLLYGIAGFSSPPGQFFLQHLDNRNGLSNSSINHIFKDADNIIWVATWDGLNMYDGSSFHVFNYNRENDFKSIGSNVIQHITEDRRGDIWVVTIEGISRFEKRTGRFYNYFYNQYQRSKISEQEYQLAVDTAGTVFCLSQKLGLSYYDAAKDTFSNCSLPQQSGKIKEVTVDENNLLWIVTNNGQLSQFTISGHQFKLVKTYNDPNSIAHFFICNHQSFYTTTANELITVNSKTFAQNKILQLPGTVSSMLFYAGHYLFAWATKGFGEYDTQFKPSSFISLDEELQVQDIHITSWALGSEQILWLGTDGNGMIKLYPKTKSFTTYTTADYRQPYSKPVRAFCEENGNLWIGTKGSGITTIQNFWTNPSPSKQSFLAPGVLDNNAVYALKKGANGLIYIGTDGDGIGVYDIKNKHFYKWTTIKGYNQYAAFGSVYAIVEDDDLSLWLGTSGYGLIHLKIDKDAAGNLSIGFEEHYQYNNTDAGPGNDIIYSLANEDANHLWIGCRYGGLSLFNKQTKKFKTFKAFTYEGSLSNNDVLSVHKDARGKLWVGTSYGLNWMSSADALKTQPVFKKLTAADGLPNNTIHAIAEDSVGNIWVSTNKGLAKVNPVDGQVSTYQQIDGLQSNEFCDGAAWKDSKGNLFFGGTYGFNYFLPQQIQKSNWLPTLLVSNVLIGQKTAEENSFEALHPTGNNLSDYTIERKNSFFELDIKAVSFLNAEKCEYAYYLEGYDKIWHYPGTSGKISYSNIPPGNYTFKVKWSNGEGVWTKEVSVFDITVKQYVWLTGYAFALYVLLLFGIGYIIFNYRKNRQQIKHELEVEHLMRTKEEEIHQNRLAFFTNIAHELQTPLTLILGSTERYIDKDASIEKKQTRPTFLTLIHQQASRLTYLIQQLLEFRKAESGFNNTTYSYLNVSELITRLAMPFTSLSEQNNMQYEYRIAPGIIAWVDKDKLEKIFFNLLSNAFKHAAKNEKIVLSVKENNMDKLLEIQVANSGCNLAPDQLDKIFDKFYVATPDAIIADKYGTGVGLAFTKQLVALLNGSITASMELDWITFTVTLPLRTEADTSSQPVAGKPSQLYQSITSFNETAFFESPVENNKLAILNDAGQDFRKNILIVEDDSAIRYLLKDVLKDDYIIYEAEDGQKALEFILKVLPDLIICDVMMPNMSGLELCNKVKDAPSTCHIPFVILSARSDIEHHTEGYEVGADAYIAKPFHTENLKVRVRKLLEAKQRLHDYFKNDIPANTTALTDLPDTDKEFLAKLVKIIEDNLADEELNASTLEKEMLLSKMQLYRKLKVITDMTPGEFIKNVRLKNAAQLLTATQLTVTEIFYRTGFNNQSYFFREFKKRYNCAPNEYRAQQIIQ